MAKEKGQGASEVKLEVQLDEEIAQGVYVNLASVNHAETEFTFDFIYVQPQANRAKVRSRVISSPLHAKHLLMVLQENVKRYEQMYGEIKPSALKMAERLEMN